MCTGGGIDIAGMEQIIAQLLLPFAAGHLARPWISAWATRNKALLAITDRGSILIVVYTAFSAAVVHGIWHQLPPVMLGVLVLIVAASRRRLADCPRRGARQRLLP